MLPPFESGERDWHAGRIAEARASFRRAAEAGDARGWFALGQLASEGTGESENPARAAQLYRLAADRGCAGAAHALAALHALGRGVKADAAQALDWYRRGAELGDPDSSFKAALMLARGEVAPPSASSFVEAEGRWRALAAQGHVASILWLGHFFSYLGPESSHVKASSFYLDVLEHTNADPAARSEAERFVEPLSSLLEVAAFTGDVDGAYQAGRWYRHAKDRVIASRYFEQAAAAGHAAAQHAVAEQLTDEERAVALYRLAADGGHAPSQMKLGVRFAAGEGVPKNRDTACVWLTRAAHQGHVGAMALLGELLALMDRHQEALQWHVRAAESQHAGAILAAATAYRDGRGGPRDLVQAVRWFLALLDFGNGDGIHEAILLAREMTNDQLVEAARLAGNGGRAELLLAGRD